MIGALGIDLTWELIAAPQTSYDQLANCFQLQSRQRPGTRPKLPLMTAAYAKYSVSRRSTKDGNA